MKLLSFIIDNSTVVFIKRFPLYNIERKGTREDI